MVGFSIVSIKMLKVLHHFSIVLFLIFIAAAELQRGATEELIAVKKSPESTSLGESTLFFVGFSVHYYYYILFIAAESQARAAEHQTAVKKYPELSSLG